MPSIKEIHQLKEYLIKDYHSRRIEEQETDQNFIDDNIQIDYLPEDIHDKQVKTGKAYRMCSAPAEHIVTNNPVLYREARGKAEQAAERVAREGNRWLRLLLRQNPQPFKEHIKKILGSGEAWIYVIHNNNFDKDNSDSLPFELIIPDPRIVFVDPEAGETNGVPNRVIICYERVASNIKATYPNWAWSNRRNREWSARIPFLMYLDNENRYFEADGDALLLDPEGNPWDGDGVQPNVYGFVPLVHCYSGFGEGSVDGDPSKLAVSRIRYARDLIREYTAIRSVLNYSIFNFSVPPLDFLYDPQIWTPPSGFTENYDRSPGAINMVPATIGDKNPMQKGTDLLPEQQVFQHLYSIESQIDQEDPLGLIGNVMGTSGRQQISAQESALRRYDTVVENSAHAFETAFGLILRMTEQMPAIRPKGWNENDVNKYYEVKIELKAEDPVAQSVQSTDGDRKQTQGIIDHETNLVTYQRFSEEEAQKIIARQLVDTVIMRDPIVMRLIAIQVAREMGMEEQYTALEQQLQQMEQSAKGGIGSQGGEPREGNIQSPLGREQPDMSLSTRPQRRRPVT